MISPFKQKVIQIVRLVPNGRVVSYGQVALYAGLPRSARQVGWILNSTECGSGLGQVRIDLPWWRVINNAGLISIKGTKFNDRVMQRRLLEAEGILVRDDFMLDIEKYRFKLPLDEIRKLQLSDAYIERIIEKYSV